MSEQVTGVVFYSIEKAIKTYRKFAQKRIDNASIDITIDQWLVLKSLNDNESISQNKLAEIIFKDVASVTRMIELLVKKGYIERSFNELDRRRFILKITAKGKDVLTAVSNIVMENRSIALKNIESDKTNELQKTLNIIISNCNHYEF